MTPEELRELQDEMLRTTMVVVDMESGMVDSFTPFELGGPDGLFPLAVLRSRAPIEGVGILYPIVSYERIMSDGTKIDFNLN